MFNTAYLSGPDACGSLPLNYKCDIKSKQFRDEGNTYCNGSNLEVALFFFNKALNHAKSKENIALAYANRSYVYLETGQFTACLDNIELARQHGYPTDKIKKLNCREQKCRMLMSTYAARSELQLSKRKIVWNYLKLSYPANKNIPWIINDLEMKRTQKYGRGLYTTRDLKPGDIICVEEVPIVIEMDDKAVFERCYNCLKTNFHNLTPCTKTASFMFCSIDCRDDFYKYVEVTSGKYDSQKFLLNKFEPAFGGRKNLEKFLDSNKSGEKSFFDYNFANVSLKEKQLNIYKTFLTSFLTPERQSPLCSCYDPETKRIVHKILSLVIFNAKIIEGIQTFTTFTSLLNHSCVPNIALHLIDNKVVFYVCRPIKANDQLFYAQTWDLTKTNKEVDRKQILTMMEINCDCIACTQNLKISDLKPEFPGQSLPKRLQGSDLKSVEDAISKAAENFEIIAKCKEATSMECYISQQNIQLVFNVLNQV